MAPRGAWVAVSVALAGSPAAGQTFGEDVAFLKRHTSVIVLQAGAERARGSRSVPTSRDGS